jgi:hypothetical protein
MLPLQASVKAVAHGKNHLSRRVVKESPVAAIFPTVDNIVRADTSN